MGQIISLRIILSLFKKKVKSCSHCFMKKTPHSLPTVPKTALDMNLSSLIHSIPVVALAGVTPFLLIVIHRRFHLNQSSATYRILWVAAYILNFITVQIPGRFDSVATGEPNFKFPHWETHFSPSGLAF
jgi:hypothetical protein